VFLAGGSASNSALDILSADSWPGVQEEDVMLQPHEIRTTWREFMSASNVQVQQVGFLSLSNFKQLIIDVIATS